jgi:hypothetical protein
MLTATAAERRGDVSCFADEVIVDFPSVAPALDRIRTAFLQEERTAAVRTPLAVTRAEARGGAVVPMQVRVRCTCRECGGRGETWDTGCARCAGTGTELLPHQVQVSVPAGVRHGERFHFTVTPRHDAPTRIELEIVIR